MALNRAEVPTETASANVTVPGPLTLLQDVASGFPAGSPSSLTVPCSMTALGKVTICAEPALTDGASFTVIMVSALVVATKSLAVRRSIYVPGVLKAAVVTRELVPFTNVAEPGPLTWVQWVESGMLDGRPSSLVV